MGNDGNWTPITCQRKTGYYIPTDDGLYADEFGHTWFAKEVARDIARKYGVMYERGNLTTVKTVVTGYRDAS